VKRDMHIDIGKSKLRKIEADTVLRALSPCRPRQESITLRAAEGTRNLSVHGDGLRVVHIEARERRSTSAVG
jgi:hypothetical protein